MGEGLEGRGGTVKQFLACGLHVQSWMRAQRIPQPPASVQATNKAGRC